MRTLTRFLILTAFGGSVWTVVSAVEPACLPVTAVPTVAPAATYLGESVGRGSLSGNMSCAAASCHGADVPKSQAGGEFHTFADSDPHRKAYGVLRNERSRRMVELLAAGVGPNEPVVPAHQNTLCLKCHGASPINLAQSLPGTSAAHRDGGSCENCHGAAEKWLTLHYTGPWEALSDGEKANFGFLPTKNMAFRSQVCAGCHVGEPGREVDHQLIAAGHPALRYELSAYQLEPVYAKHWREKRYGPDVEAWTWLIGQVGTARAAADLLRHRAETAEHTTRDWPEFAEYTCFSCHQGINTPLPKKGDPVPDLRTERKARALPWGSWLYPIPLDLARTRSDAWTGPPENVGDFLGLAKLFHAADRPSPGVVASQAGKAVAELDGWLEALQTMAEKRSVANPLSAGELRAALAHAAKFAGDVPASNSPSTDWDRYTQGFLATTALYRSLCVADPTARSFDVESELASIAAELRFPPRQDSPAQSPAVLDKSLAGRWALVRSWAGQFDNRAGVLP